jgi:YHS domain-containing protein
MSCAAKNYDKNRIVINSLAKQGELTKCPISGVVFTITENTGIIKYGDKTYHTCCGSCANMFSDQPSKYLPNLN